MDSTFLASSQLTIRTFTDPDIELSMFMLSFIPQGSGISYTRVSNIHK